MQAFGLFLSEITLKNFATFEDQNISFDENFNAIIGETGSGKSLILDAIQLILGHRADKKLIRFGSEFSTIEATFRCSDHKVRDFFFENDFPFESDEITIKRVLYPSGKSRSYLNHQSCSLNMLSHFSGQFIDLVGQFENQKLLSENYQLDLLDNFIGNQTLKRKYIKLFDEIVQTEQEFKKLQNKNSETATRLDYIHFQLKELKELSPSIENEEQLLLTKKKLQDFEAFQKNLLEINSIFNGTDISTGLFSYLDRVEKLLDQNFASSEQITSFTNAKETLNDLNYSLNSNESSDFDEENFEEVIDQLDLYQKLKRKFNTDTLGLIKIYQDFLEEKESLENLDQSLNHLEEKLASLKLKAYDIAQSLHTTRLEGSAKLSNALTKSVQDLMMIGATIRIDLKQLDDLNRNGLTQISLNSETNPGEGFFKVREIASGGELSRILLAMRKVLANNDSISIFLFDEIDAGIGGETALTIGRSLADVAANSQVIAITHLPQIANFSNKLIIVDKGIISKESETRTISQVREVIGENLKAEVISMTPLN